MVSCPVYTQRLLRGTISQRQLLETLAPHIVERGRKWERVTKRVCGFTETPRAWSWSCKKASFPRVTGFGYFLFVKRRRKKNRPTPNLTHTHSSDGAPHPDGALKNTGRSKILHYRRLYDDRSDPIVFMSLTVNTSVNFGSHREVSPSWPETLAFKYRGIWLVSFSSCYLFRSL
jgi:hypothetical protein